ncbi:MAG: NAD(P)/FAD-dependent oxidoreductase [Bryobacter sp.]|nr:NAD(P)/FAD-dependent oxidoreductase [Bryobacter sp.]
MPAERAIIIGAGPAGLTAAYELLQRTGIQPIVLEKSDCVGGISRTVNYKGNRMDLGGHRFFSKSDRVMQWWLEMLPLEAAAEGAATIRYHGMERQVAAVPEPDARSTNQVMLLRPRKSRIYYLRKFFDYPISLSADTIRKLGLWRTGKIGISYLASALNRGRVPQNLEEFMIDRFGRELYRTFFQPYTEKVWGVPCRSISAAWGAQRIKGLSIRSAVWHAMRKLLPGRKDGVGQKGVETSLIERFLYPKFGPGQMWEETARRVKEKGGVIRMHCRVERVVVEDGRVRAVIARDANTGEELRFVGEYFFSTAPVKELLRGLDPPPPPEVLAVSDGLVYRDFITVGLLVRSLRIREESEPGRKLVRDNWIYIQEPDVNLGRLQIFNNWSPHLVADPETVWLGLEYFCNDTDDLWKLPDEKMIALATEELSRIGIIDTGEVLDATVLRMEKTYPAYFGTYDRFDEVRAYVDGIENLFLIGRNGMHRYNNQDHSMLTAMMAVDQIATGIRDRAALWRVNTEMDYHEQAGNSE